MMKKITSSILVLLMSIFTVYGQVSIFYEDFSKDENGPTQTGSITNWNILSGNIDVSDTYIQSSSYTGKAIDLAGLVNGTIETKNTLTLTPGTYTISFLTKDNTYGNSAMLLEIGTVFSKQFNATSNVETYSETFTVTTTTSAKIKMTEMGPSNNGGTFVADIKLSIPCPFIAFYEDFSKDTNGPTQTGSITNWNILNGNIDVSDTYIQSATYTGKAIDLAGLVNGSVETKNSITLYEGTYNLSFLAKDNTYGNSAMLVEIGNVFSKQFNASSTVKTYSETFTVATSQAVKIKLTELGPSNDGGTFIGDIKLSVQCPVVTSVESNEKEANWVRVFPNPSNGILNIEAPNNSKIVLISNNGQIQELTENSNNVYNLNVKPGMYFLKISNKEKVEYKKVQITE